MVEKKILDHLLAKKIKSILFIYFEEISTDILNNVSGNNIESAISRIDNRTNICPTCGIKEALEQFIKQKNAPRN